MLRQNRKKPGIILGTTAALMTIVACLWAQARIGTVTVRVSLDRADWTYKPGDPVKVKINVVQDGQPVPNAKVTYSFGPEMMPPTVEKTVAVPAEGLIVEAGTMKEPGFLRCIVTTEMNGRRYRGLATAAAALDPRVKLISLLPEKLQVGGVQPQWAQRRVLHRHTGGHARHRTHATGRGVCRVGQGMVLHLEHGQTGGDQVAKLLVSRSGELIYRRAEKHLVAG